MKLTKVERVIQSLEADKTELIRAHEQQMVVLNLAIKRLREQATPKKAKPPTSRREAERKDVPLAMA